MQIVPVTVSIGARPHASQCCLLEFPGPVQPLLVPSTNIASREVQLPRIVSKKLTSWSCLYFPLVYESELFSDWLLLLVSHVATRFPIDASPSVSQDLGTLSLRNHSCSYPKRQRTRETGFFTHFRRLSVLAPELVACSVIDEASLCS